MANNSKQSAFVLYTDGRREDVSPKNGTDFSLEELQKIVGGYIEIVSLNRETILVCNENGKQMKLPFNVNATWLLARPRDFVVGNVLICHTSQIK